MKKSRIEIQTSSQDMKGSTNETGVSMVKNGQLQHAIAEERISRVKLDGQFLHNHTLNTFTKEACQTAV